MPRHFENSRPRWQTGETVQQKWNKLANALHREWAANGNPQYMAPQTAMTEVVQQARTAESIPRQLAHVALAAER